MTRLATGSSERAGSLVITKIFDFRTTSLTGPQDNCVTEAHGTVRSRGRRQGRPLENRAVRTTDASAWPGCSRGVAPEGGRTNIPARGDLPLTTQTYASWNLEGYCKPIYHGGILPRSRGGGGQSLKPLDIFTTRHTLRSCTPPVATIVALWRNFHHLHLQCHALRTLRWYRHRLVKQLV